MARRTTRCEAEQLIEIYYKSFFWFLRLFVCMFICLFVSIIFSFVFQKFRLFRFLICAILVCKINDANVILYISIKI